LAVLRVAGAPCPAESPARAPGGTRAAPSVAAVGGRGWRRGPAGFVGGLVPPTTGSKGAVGCATSTGGAMGWSGRPARRSGAWRPCAAARTVGNWPRRCPAVSVLRATSIGAGTAANAPLSGGSVSRLRKMATRTCRICGRECAPGKWWRERCIACYTYWHRTGQERPTSPRPCPICGQLTQSFRRSRCRACYAYWYRTGRERPPERWQR
jgi:hypothetical protein